MYFRPILFDCQLEHSFFVQKNDGLRKKLASRTITPKTNPIELYGTLDRKSVAGPLRPAQEIVLSEWYTKRRTDRDLIIKLHTGEGKTLICLLILQ